MVGHLAEGRIRVALLPADVIGDARCEGAAEKRVGHLHREVVWIAGLDADLLIRNTELGSRYGVGYTQPPCLDPRQFSPRGRFGVPGY